MAAKKPKPDDDDDVQKVVLEDVGPRAKAAHEKAVNDSVFTDKVLLAAFVAITSVATFGQMFMQYKLAQSAAIKVEQVAVKAEEVKQTLDESTKSTGNQLEELVKTTEATHELVNSGSLVTLKLLADVTRWKADQTGDPDHIKAAELAEKNVKEHEAKQATVDGQQSKNSN